MNRLSSCLEPSGWPEGAWVKTSPNPMVGAVVVKDGKIVGEGFHRTPGEPHAEVDAIRAAGIETQGAELFVALEPCNHYSKHLPALRLLWRLELKKYIMGLMIRTPP